MSVAEHFDKPVDSPLVADLGRWLRRVLSRNLTRHIAFAMLAAVVLASTVAALVKPEFNWDMAPYIAVSLEDRISDPTELHRESWRDIQAMASPRQWYELTEGNPYNADMWKNPEHFASQLTMYRVKIGYMEAIRFLDHYVSPVLATQLIAAFSALAIGVLALWWLAHANASQAALLLAPGLMLAGYFDMALLATPDLFMSAFGLLGIYLIIRDKAWFGAPFLFAAFLIRPDMIIFLFAWLLAALAFGTTRLPALITFVLAVAAYFPIAAAAGHTGWWPHFYFSIIELQNDMRGFSPPFDPVVYIKGLVRGVSVSLRWNNWPMILALLLAGWWLLVLNRRSPSRLATMMLVALCLNFAGKFVTFPLPDDRVYFMFIAAFMLILCETWKPNLEPARLLPQGDEPVRA